MKDAVSEEVMVKVFIGIVVFLAVSFIFAMILSIHNDGEDRANAEIVISQYMTIEFKSTSVCPDVSIEGLMKDGIISNKEYEKFMEECYKSDMKIIKDRLK